MLTTLGFSMNKRQIKKEINERLRIAELDMILSGSDGMRPCDIARASGMSMKDVNNTLERAIAKIRKKGINL